jgi:hypothetical protein
MDDSLPIIQIHDVTGTLEDRAKEKFPQIARVTIRLLDGKFEAYALLRPKVRRGHNSGECSRALPFCNSCSIG